MEKDETRLLAHCGLYCGLCANRNRIPQRAKLLQETLREEGMDWWYKYDDSMKDTFPVFWEFLDGLVKMDCTCRGEGGPPDCKIRNCAREKGVETCPFCNKYPCDMIEGLAEHYVLVTQDGKRLRKIGLKAWTAEQEERARKGVVYADTRIPWEESST